MKIEYYTYPDAPILFRGGVGIYIILTLYFLISGELFGGSLLFSVPWILLGGYGLFYFALMPYHILFDENQVEYKTLCGKVKTFPVRGVSFREEEEYSKSKGSYWVLCIYFPKYRIKIHRDDNPQYTKILNYCQQHLLKKYNEYRDTRYLIPFYIGVIFIGVHLFYIFKCRTPEVYGTEKIMGTYSKHTISSSKGKRKRYYKLEIQLKEYPHLTFGEWYVKKENVDEIDRILRSQPHTFVFTISRNDYLKKIEKSMPMKFCDMYMNRNNIEVREFLQEIQNDIGHNIFSGL